MASTDTQQIIRLIHDIKVRIKNFFDSKIIPSPKPMQNAKDEALRLFGLSSSATKNQIKIRYKQLAKKYHPDIPYQTDANKLMMQKINLAYTVLKSSTKD